MASKMHNLAGFLRDLRFALEAGHELGYQLAELLVEVDELLTDAWHERRAAEDSSVEPADDAAGERPVDDMDVRDTGDRPSMGGPAQGHVAGVLPQLGTLPGLGDPVERVRQLAQQGAGGTGGTPALAGSIVRRRSVNGGT